MNMSDFQEIEKRSEGWNEHPSAIYFAVDPEVSGFVRIVKGPENGPEIQTPI